MGTSQPSWADLLAIARFTPSPHNTQPWKLRPIDDRRAELLIVRARTLPDEDTSGCFIRCAMGMFIESLSIAASNVSHRLRAVLQGPEIDSGAEMSPLAMLTLEADPAIAVEYSNQSILDRRTSRLHPDDKLVPQEVLDRFAAVAAAGGQKFVWTVDSAQIRRVLDQNVRAIAKDLNHKPYHDEIVTWFRYSERQAAAACDGLDARAMNTPAHELKLIAKMPGLMRAPITAPLMRALYHRRLGGATQLALLSGPFFGHESSIAAGRCLMRLWLTMHESGVSIHPFGNLVTNRAAASWLDNEMNVGKIWLVFRMGYTPVPPRSKRLGVEQILC